MIGSWGDTPAESLAAAVGHMTSWCVTTWLITLSVVAGVAAVLLFGQYAAFRGALPFPQFLAFAALGAARWRAGGA